jgi:sugar lactone lactonase YvrE/transcriptional regulator with XRE-family HTH domain
MTVEDASSFAVLLSRFRIAVGLTQEELAERSGLSVEAISVLERGVRTRPRAITVHHLAEALALASDDRTRFERAARRPPAAAVDGDAQVALPTGNFLGALPSSSLVGRDEEMHRILTVLDAVATGAGHLVVLVGEPGAGKTRLAQELTVEAGRRGFLVATGRCPRAEDVIVYSPIFAALDALVDGPPAKSWTTVQPEWPGARHAVVDRTGSSDLGAGGRRSGVAATNVLLAAARSAPVAFLLDDLQWADEATLLLLQHLARSTRGARVLLVGIFRDGHVVADHPALAQALTEMSRERLAETVAVRRLSSEETSALISTLMEQEIISEEFSAFVYRRTKGNPRLVEGMIRSLGGRLQLTREIGAGAMGRVFEAFDTRLNATVAAKLMLARVEVDLDALLRFQQEAAVLGTLQHPHIVRIYDSFIEEHASCIIMELLDGPSLRRILNDGPLPLPRAQRIALQVAEALSYAHGHGIAHRDIKPDNIVVLPGDRVKVTDFGIARILRTAATLETIATTGMRLGTPLYMAPEQVEGKHIDGRADIYALGAVLYQAMTGRPPFEGDDPLTIAIKHLQEVPCPPRAIDTTLPTEWERVILKALAKDPAERFQTADEFRLAVAGLPLEPKTRVGSPPDLDSRSEPLVQAPSARPRRLRAPIVAAIVVAATIAAVTALSPWLRPSARALHHTGMPIAVWGVKPPSSFRFQAPLVVGAGLSGDMYLGDDGWWLTNGPGIYTGILRVSRAGKVLAAFGSFGSGPGQVGIIDDIAVDPHGTVYIADEQNNRLDRFTRNGKPLASIGSRGVNPGQFYHPQGVTFDVQGNIYVADAYNNRVQKLSPTGRPLAIFGSPGTGRDQLGGPTALGVDREGNIYVSETQTYRIHKFAPNGKTLAVWGSKGTGPGQFLNPQNVKVDAAGNVDVLDAGDNRVEKFTRNGKFITMWGSKGTGPGQFLSPTSLTIDDQGYIYVGDLGMRRVQKFTSSGRLVGQWTAAQLTGQLLASPSDVALDGHGDVYITDAARNEVKVLSPTGDFLRHWGRSGTQTGEFRHPTGITLDPHGNVYVTDTDNGRVQEFSADGVFLTAWRTSISGKQGHPVGIAVDSRGTIYVTDNRANLVEGYSSQHALRLQWGATSPGFALYRLDQPDGIAVDARGNVYVADSGNHRVVEFAPVNLHLRFFPAGRIVRTWSGSPGTGLGKILQPVGVAVDARGNIYVTDSSASDVEVFTPSGASVVKWGSRGGNPGRFQDPNGIALDTAGNIYVTDTGNARIQKFESIQ